MEYLIKMKEQGVVKYIGVTGHRNPAAHMRALELWDQGWKFDAMQFPINPIDFHQLSFQKELLPQLVKRRIAVLAMNHMASDPPQASSTKTPPGARDLRAWRK